jgi:hypothetical protein
MMVLAFTFNMMVLNFSSSLFLTFLHRSNCWVCTFLVLFCRCSFFTGYYILNLSASIVGASAAIMGILVAVDLSALMNVRLLLIGILNYGILQL